MVIVFSVGFIKRDSRYHDTFQGRILVNFKATDPGIRQEPLHYIHIVKVTNGRMVGLLLHGSGVQDHCNTAAQ